MITLRAPPPHLEIQRAGAGYVSLLRTSYRDGDKVRHLQCGRSTDYSLAPVLKTHDVNPQTRWSIDYVIERLKSIRQERRTRAGAEWYACTKPDAEQREMPAAPGVTL